MKPLPAEPAAKTFERLRSAQTVAQWAQLVVSPFGETGWRAEPAKWLLAATVWILAFVVLRQPYWVWGVPAAVSAGVLHLRARRSEKLMHQGAEEYWRFDAATRCLEQWDAGGLVRTLKVQDADKLIVHGGAVPEKRRAERYFYLEYHRPYPAPEIRLMVFAFGKQEETAAFIGTARHLAALMGIVLEDYLG